MIRPDHELVHADDAGNGYHGYCKHCGMPLVTDLGYTSWDNTICDSGPEEERVIEAKLKSQVSEVFRLAYEYHRFMRNWGKEFDREGWDYIRGNAEPYFMEVKKARRKHKFDEMTPDVIKHILWNCGTGDERLKLEKNKLVFKY